MRCSKEIAYSPGSSNVPGGPSPHADVSHARSVTALCACFSLVNSSSVFVSTSVYGRPCRRVWCRTGSAAESIWVWTCRNPSVASGHSKIQLVVLLRHSIHRLTRLTISTHSLAAGDDSFMADDGSRAVVAYGRGWSV